MHKKCAVPIENLKKNVDLSKFEFITTEDIQPLTTVIGQNRAVRAIDFGHQRVSLLQQRTRLGPSGTLVSFDIAVWMRRHVGGYGDAVEFAFVVVIIIILRALVITAVVVDPIAAARSVAA